MKTLTLGFLFFFFALLVLNKILSGSVENFQVEQEQVQAKQVQSKQVQAKQEQFKDNTIDLPKETITGESLCTMFSSKPMELNNKCNTLTEQNCNATSCCGWLNGKTCVAGGANGPTFRTTKGEDIEVLKYSYMGKESQ